jgi:tetratricopeptide (TPR) repeat protein
LGSDGRDDILLEGETGSFLNENENKFLEFVEKSSGNLDKLEEELLKSGSLIDDLSLMRISFIEVQEKILTIDDDIIRFIQQGEEYESQKLFESAISVFENAIFQSPSNPFILKKLAKLHERVKNYPKTIEYCKKYFELNPDSSDYLYYISYYSKILNDYEESIEFGERFRLRDPSNKENLENLSESYRLFGNTERSTKILELV